MTQLQQLVPLQGQGAAVAPMEIDVGHDGPEAPASNTNTASCPRSCSDPYTLHLSLPWTPPLDILLIRKLGK